MRSERAQTLALVLAGITLAGLGWRSWYVCDDAYIAFRYVRNWADGVGLLYNVEDGPIEGFSNFLWVALATGLRKLGFDEVRVMPAVSIALAVATQQIAAAWLRRIEPERPWLGVGAAWLLALNAGFANWATSGLETMQWCFTLFVGFLLWFYEANAVARGLVLVAIAASRPEGVAWAPVLVVLGAVRRPRSWGALFGAAGLAVVGIAGLLFARYAWFGDLVTNTSHAKGGSTLDFYLRGVRYVLLAGWQTLLPIVGMPFVAWRVLQWRPTRAIAPLEAAAAMVAGHYALTVGVGGDYMPFARFLNSAMPYLAVLVAHGLGTLLSRKVAIGALATIALASTLPQFGVSLASEGMRKALAFRMEKDFYPDERTMWHAERTRALAWQRLGRLLRHALQPDERIATVAIGALGYYSHRYVYDVCYLVQRIPEGTVLERGKHSPGHDTCVRKLTDEQMLAERVVKTWGVLTVPAHAQAGDAWTELLPDGTIRTYYRTNKWLADAPEGEFFYVDRYREPWFTVAEAG